MVFITSLFLIHSLYSFSIVQPSEKDFLIMDMENKIKNKKVNSDLQHIKETLIYPNIKVGGKDYNVKNVSTWDDLVLLAATLNSECRGCSEQEKEALAQVVANRVDNNYNNYGSTYYEQISARSQFSGFKKGKSTGHYFYYNGLYKIKDLINNRVVYKKDFNQIKQYINKNNNVSFDDLIINMDEYSKQNYRIAHKIIVKGFRSIPCNVVNFCNSKIATNKVEVARQRKNQIDLSEYGYDTSGFGHDIFAEDKKLKCSASEPDRCRALPNVNISKSSLKC